MTKQIERVYTGHVAANYDAVRGNSDRWAREAEVIEPLLRTISAGTKLIDVAAGTGRWLNIYREIGLDATLLDSSADMLSVAKEKAAAVVTKRISSTGFRSTRSRRSSKR